MFFRPAHFFSYTLLCASVGAIACADESSESSDDASGGDVPSGPSAATGGGEVTSGGNGGATSGESGGEGTSTGDEGTASEASSGEGATSGHGGETTGGEGGTGTGSPPEEEHCEPGDYTFGQSSTSEGNWENCSFDPTEFGLPAESGNQVQNVALITPMTAGAPYAISFEFFRPGTAGMEIWGTNEVCGQAAELLTSESTQLRNLMCLDMVPSGDYENILIVWRGTGFQWTDSYYCANTECTSP